MLKLAQKWPKYPQLYEICVKFMSACIKVSPKYFLASVYGFDTKHVEIEPKVTESAQIM